MNRTDHANPGAAPGYDLLLRGILTGNDTADEAAIKEVCLKETWGNHQGDSELWASCWLHRDDCSLTGVLWDAGLFTWNGWEEIEAAIRPELEARAQGRLTSMPFRHVGHRINVSGDMAWATFTEMNWLAEDSERGTEFDVMEYRVLERRAGLWKIVHLIFIPLETDVDDHSHIQIDGSGQVQRISPAARDALTDSGLTISAGRIRAVSPNWDRELQAVIARLNKSTGLAELSTTSLERTVFHRQIASEFPVMLGENPDGGQRYCIVTIRDGRLFISLDGPSRIDRRLSLSNIVYGLTDPQMRLAREIVAGSSLATAAEKLGISVNTARTHRNRIFRKIGVNSQAALVRCLLSVGG